MDAGFGVWAAGLLGQGPEDGRAVCRDRTGGSEGARFSNETLKPQPHLGVRHTCERRLPCARPPRSADELAVSPVCQLPVPPPSGELGPGSRTGLLPPRWTRRGLGRGPGPGRTATDAARGCCPCSCGAPVPAPPAPHLSNGGGRRSAYRVGSRSGLSPRCVETSDGARHAWWLPVATRALPAWSPRVFCLGRAGL